LKKESEKQRETKPKELAQKEVSQTLSFVLND